MKVREVRKEMLDDLAPTHPDAMINRKNLHSINRLLGTHRWFDRVLKQQLGRTDRVLELGAGQGLLSDFLRRRHGGEAEWHALDIQSVPARIDLGLYWHQADLLTFENYADYEVVFGNFILHQFQNSELHSLRAGLQAGPRALIFQELWRRSVFYCGSFLLTLFMHPITRHDARVSVRAGFRGNELAELLGLKPPAWKVSVEYSLLGAYRMVAVRN